MIELPDLAKRLTERFPDIGEFELRPHPTTGYPPADAVLGIALTLHFKAPLSESARVSRTAIQISNDPEWRALGINDMAFTLYGEWESW